MIEFMSHDASNNREIKPLLRTSQIQTNSKSSAPRSGSAKLRRRRPLRARGLGRHLDKILFTFACTYLLAAIWWLVSQQKLQLPSISKFNPVTPKIAENTSQPNSDSEFIAYMEKALAAIERKLEIETSKDKAKQITSPVATSSLQGTKIIERVYIPIYRQSRSYLGSVPRLNVPTPPPPNTTVAKNLPTPPISTPQGAARYQTVPELELQANIPSLSTPSPTVNHTLVGLLESGDSSVALFKINGVTQRIHLGEEIGTSGWSLISVTEQKAMIQGHGQVRYIAAGEKI